MSQYRPRQEFHQAPEIANVNANKQASESTTADLKRGQQFDADVEIESIEIDSIESDVSSNLAQDQYLAQQASVLSPATSTKRKQGSRLAWAALMSLLLLLLVEFGITLWQAWQTAWPLFSLYLTVFALSSLWLGRGLWREFKLLKRLKQCEQTQQQATRLQSSMQVGEAQALIERIGQGLPELAKTPYQAFCALDQQHMNDAERLKLFDVQVLSVLDKQAQQIVHRYATEAALMMAASPLAVLDMALILWRNQKMLQAIADNYGITLGYWSRLKLFKAVLVNVLYGGVTELALDLSGQALSMEVTSRFSASLAQGVGSGLLTARLGYQAMASCRPLSFGIENKPKLSKIHQALLGTVKRFVMGEKAKPSVERVHTSKAKQD